MKEIEDILASFEGKRVSAHRHFKGPGTAHYVNGELTRENGEWVVREIRGTLRIENKITFTHAVSVTVETLRSGKKHLAIAADACVVTGRFSQDPMTAPNQKAMHMRRD